MASFPPLTTFKLTVQEVDGVGDLGYERGTYELAFTPPGASAPVTDHGKFLNVNRRNADGTWSLTNDTFNSDLPVAAPPPPPGKPAAKAPAKHK
jgi:ketosteroid isomerase-like protein